MEGKDPEGSARKITARLWNIHCNAHLGVGVCVCVSKFQFPGAKLIYDTNPNKLITALFLIVMPQDGYFQAHIVQKSPKLETQLL